jgi:hypothetical protein
MSLNVKFSATDAGFTSTVSKVKTSVKSMDDSVAKTASSVKTSFGSMVKAGAGLALGFGAIKAAAKAITGTFDQFGKALAMGGELDDLNTRTGETVANLAVLQNAFEFTGVGADKVGGTINKLQKFMDDAAQGSEKNNEVLGRLGLTMADMAGKTPTQQMELLADRLQAVGDDGEASALAMSIFGKAGGQLLPILKNFSSELGDARDRLGSMPLVMQESAQAFARIEDNIATAKNKFMEFAAGLLNELAPAIELATKLISNFDAAAVGMKLGEIITGASNAMGGFTDALSAIKLSEFGLAFKITFESIKLQAADSINSIAANVMAAVQASGAFLLAAFGPGSGIYTIIEAQINKLSLKIQLAIEEANPFRDQLNIDGLKQAIASSERLIGTAMGVIGEDFARAGQEFTKTFDQSLSSARQLIDTSAMEVKLQEHRNELKKLEAAAAADAAAAAANKLTVEEISVKTAKDRLSHEERIKELDADIASAKRQGNKEELAALEAMKAYHIELQASKEKGLSLDEAMANANKARQNIIDGVVAKNKDELAIKKEITKELEKQLGLGQQIIADANAAQRKDRLDPGGQLEKQAREAIGQGNFAEARRVGRTLESRERNRAFQEAFGKKEGGIGRNVQDIAKEQGIDTFGKTKRQLQDELMKKRQEEMKPGAEGKKGDKPGEAAKQKEQPENLLQKAVDAIKLAVESLEKKLPVPALGA